MKHSIVIITDSGVIILIQHTVIDELADRLVSQIWIDCTGTITEKRCKMMYLSRLCCL